MKQIGRRRWITPFAILKCGHVEMQEHAETQIHEPLLQFQELPTAKVIHAACFVLCGSGGMIAKQYRGSGGFADQLEKLSSCCHFQYFTLAVCILEIKPTLHTFSSNMAFVRSRTIRPTSWRVHLHSHLVRHYLLRIIRSRHIVHNI